MKYLMWALIAIVVIVLVVLVFKRLNRPKSSFVQRLENQTLAESTKIIQEKLGCSSELLLNAVDADEVMKKYLSLYDEGKHQGFTPVIIVPSFGMSQIIDREPDTKIQSDYDNSIDGILHRAEMIDVTSFLEKRKADSLPIGDDDYDIWGEYKDSTPILTFNVVIDFGTKKPYSTLIIAKLPTQNAWEAAAWLSMGGYNECPLPEEQVAVFKYWFDKYGAVPAVVSNDIWQMYVANPPTEKSACEALAVEQFAFCSDIVTQGIGTINHLAGSLKDSKVWYFWWD